MNTRLESGLRRRIIIWQTLGFLAGFVPLAVVAMAPEDMAGGAGMFSLDPCTLFLAILAGLSTGVFAKVLAWGILKKDRRILKAAAVGVSLGVVFVITGTIMAAAGGVPWRHLLGQAAFLAVFFCFWWGNLFMIPAWRESMQAAQSTPSNRP